MNINARTHPPKARILEVITACFLRIYEQGSYISHSEKIFQERVKPKYDNVEHVKNIKRLLDFWDFIYQNSSLAYFIYCVWEAQSDAVLFFSTNVTTSTSLPYHGVICNLFLM